MDVVGGNQADGRPSPHCVAGKRDPDWFARIAVWSRSLSPDDRERARTALQIRSFDKGATVCEQGQLADHWIGVVDGLVKVGTTTPDGKEITFAGMHAGGWFGEGTILKNEVRRYEVTALRSTQVAFLDRRTFLWLYEHSVPFNQFLIAQLNERLGQFIGLIEHARKLDTTTRVARALTELLNPVLYPEAGPQLTINQEELGLLAGVSRPVANQALRELERLGFLSVTYGGILLSDPVGLRRYGE
ncbi:MAG: Crp/Fnr family transcriptional regulator [Pseudomonadota bacterium]